MDRGVPSGRARAVDRRGLPVTRSGRTPPAARHPCGVHPRNSQRVVVDAPRQGAGVRIALRRHAAADSSRSSEFPAPVATVPGLGPPRIRRTVPVAAIDAPAWHGACCDRGHARLARHHARHRHSHPGTGGHRSPRASGAASGPPVGSAAGHGFRTQGAAASGRVRPGRRYAGAAWRGSARSAFAWYTFLRMASGRPSP